MAPSKKERFAAAFATPLRRFCQKYEFKESDVKRMYALFEKVDKDKSGEIVLDEFFDLLHLDWLVFKH